MLLYILLHSSIDAHDSYPPGETLAVFVQVDWKEAFYVLKAGRSSVREVCAGRGGRRAWRLLGVSDCKTY